MKFNLKQKKSQSFSTDILIVVVVILFGALFLVLNQIDTVQQGPSNEQTYEIASYDANLLVNNLKFTNIVSKDNEVDVDRLIALNHEVLAEELGLRNDFCIVFEKDGKLVKIDPENNVNGIGSSNIEINGVPCK